MSDNFIVVGIGASAGGLNAFEKIFKTIKAKCNISFIVIQHLDPEHDSYLPEIISRYTDLPVRSISEGIRPEPGVIYINTSGKLLTLQNRVVTLKETINKQERLQQIDHFFTSLAENYEERAVAVILSGNGRDGSLGIESIKENGGLVLVQDPQTAAFPGMPMAALDTGLADYVLSADQIRDKLCSINEFAHLLLSNSDNDNDFTGQIITLLYKNTGHDFSGYKDSTVQRRIKRQMLINNFSSLEKYYLSMVENPQQCELLLKELLIGVTSFFRDQAAFKSLEENVIIPLLTEKTETLPIRIWIAGCSTGEETYSIALLLKKHIDSMKICRTIQIFATDINNKSLETARKGIYPSAIEQHIPEDLLLNYFDFSDGKYRVKKEIREWIVFSSQSLVKDPPFSRIDLISCRNVMIYLGVEIQKKILAIFNYSLRPGGFLFLGSAENIGNYGNTFSNVDKSCKIYKNIASRQTNGFTGSLSGFRPGLKFTSDDRNSKVSQTLTQKDLVEKVLLEQFVPSAVLVNENAEIVYNYGKNNIYLEAPQGTASLNILSMTRDGLKIPLTTAFKNAVDTQSKQVVERVTLKHTNEYHQLRLSVLPAGTLGDKNYYLIVFEDICEDTSFDDLKLNINDQKDSYILRLEEELNLTREYLYRTNEELDESNEELKSANEELIAANEELQSSNEELETSKEELQSMNEELLTVNTELDFKNRELIKSNYDLDNLFNNLQVGILYLDSNLNIIRFTQAATDVINLIPGDIGRPIVHTVNNFSSYNDFKADLEGVLKSGKPVEKEIVLLDQKIFWLRIIPYHSDQQEIKGLVVTFNDITTLKSTDNALKISEDKYLKTIEMLPIGVFEMDLNGRLTFANSSAFKYFGYSQEEFDKGIKVADLLDEQSRHIALQDIKKLLETGISSRRPFYFVHDNSGRIFPVEIHSSLIRSQDGSPAGLRGTIFDITDKLKNEEERQKNNKLESIGVLAGGIAHDFNNILTAILGNISLARYQMSDTEKNYKLLLESEKAAIRARDLTNQLLTFAKGGNPVMDIINIQKVIRDSAEFVMRGSNCSLHLNFPDDLYQTHADSGQISQVIQNLIINSLQAMPNGGKIFIAGENRFLDCNNIYNLPPKNYIIITIKDEGSGIAQEIIEKIFDPYFTTKPTGSGLGLSICFSVIKKHSGTITVESKPGEGTIFTIFLPAVISAADTTQICCSYHSKIQTKNRRVLFMDDELMLRTLAKELFRILDLEIELAADGDEAISLYTEAFIQGNKFDLVILDLTVPGKKGGQETIKELLQIDPSVKAVVSSGYSNNAVLANYSDYGFANVLTKPFSKNDIVRVLNELF